MKRAILLAAAAALTVTAGAASAQPRDHYDNHRYDSHDNGRRDNGRHHWRRGERLDARFHSRKYMVSDWRRHGWRAPPRGYAYYRTDSGDVVLAAVASGIVSAVIANAMAH